MNCPYLIGAEIKEKIRDMQVELKQIVDQLSDAIKLDENSKVAAFVDDDGKTIVGWTIAEVKEDGTLIPTGEKFKTIKDLLLFYY